MTDCTDLNKTSIDLNKNMEPKLKIHFLVYISVNDKTFHKLEIYITCRTC